MDYTTHVVPDDELVEGVNCLFLRHDGHLMFLVRESITWRPHRLEAELDEAWRIYRGIADEEYLSWPERELATA